MENQKLLIALKSCWTYQYEAGDVGAAHRNGPDEPRSRAIRETWYKTWQKHKDAIDLKFFYGTPKSENTERFEENTIVLDCPDDYVNLPRKTQKMMEWAYENEYTSVLMADDDVYIWPTRLLDDVKTWVTPPVYRGHANGWFNSGAAYWVNVEVMKIIASEKWKREDTTFEDQWVGKTLQKYGILPEHDERYHVCPCEDCLKKTDLSKRITQLTSNPLMMHDLHKRS